MQVDFLSLSRSSFLLTCIPLLYNFVCLSDSVPAQAHNLLLLLLFLLLIIFCFRQTAFQKFRNLTHICECMWMWWRLQKEELVLDKNSRDNVISFFFYSNSIIIIMSEYVCMCLFLRQSQWYTHCYDLQFHSISCVFSSWMRIIRK